MLAELFQKAITWAEAHPDLSGWAQCIAAILAIIVAIAAPMLQHWLERRSGAAIARQEVIDLRSRLTASLQADVNAIIGSLEAKQEAIEATIQAFVIARANKEPFPDANLPARPLGVTDGVIYRAIASNLGLFPGPVITRVVGLYSYLAEIDGMAGASASQIGYIDAVRASVPRAIMIARWLLAVLAKFEKAGFPNEANVTVGLEEMRTLADQSGYPIDQIAQDLGANLPARQSGPAAPTGSD